MNSVKKYLNKKIELTKHYQSELKQLEVMPAVRRSNLGRRSRSAINNQNFRNSRTQEERTEINASIRAQMAQLRAAQRPPQARQNNRGRRAANENLNRAAFPHNPETSYKDLTCVVIGSLSAVCQHCNALKFRLETPGLCCAGGKIKLPVLAHPPEPLYSLLYGNSAQSNSFLKLAQKYNGCFQMTSFGAEVVQQSGYNPSYKVMASLYYHIFSKLHPNIQIQGQIHHRAGALLPPQNKDHKFLQIYFIGDSEVELNHRCAIFTATKREIIQQLQNLLHEHNELVRLFKTALDIMHYDEHKIIISADKRPTGSHARQFNAPTINEVAVVIVGENVESRDIVLKRRDNGQLQRVYETHRSYDALQYPLMFCRGEDGYHFNIKMVNPTTEDSVPSSIGICDDNQ
ncbi:uncharacterized protein [Drosophila kikkawai]|uniref:Helitron helicase-like domain-containing protein n=1 Tax=Drosophila kikkawai TaxID=30033 RepID=A0ABM4GJZ1_DROKI